ncbi:hypothetical protein [Vibrio phage vB_VmeM-Yong XC32]|nr:hypothetical protein [Vibrio phage vB_VmeM-Yong XC31]QAX96405.1 hypothetical protein [Vibrio phage vB_VmeM-Yong XC32]QAX96722.1 hypothetical protein [Vibrio phage vB_VmeM-Yong MS31]QAX97041.1 hypothetical protein [Vibrio phage vB_VmeM-Yong MS32]
MSHYEESLKIASYLMGEIHNEEKPARKELDAFTESYGEKAGLLIFCAFASFCQKRFESVASGHWKLEGTDVIQTENFITVQNREVEAVVSKSHYPVIYSLLAAGLNHFGESYVQFYTQEFFGMSACEKERHRSQQKERVQEETREFIRDFFTRPDFYLRQAEPDNGGKIHGRFLCVEGPFKGLGIKLVSPTDVIIAHVTLEDQIVSSFIVWSRAQQAFANVLCNYLFKVGLESDCSAIKARDRFLASYPKERTARDIERLNNDAALTGLRDVLMAKKEDDVPARLEAVKELSPVPEHRINAAMDIRDSLNKRVFPVKEEEDKIAPIPAPIQCRPKATEQATWVTVLEYSFFAAATLALAGKLFGWF